MNRSAAISPAAVERRVPDPSELHVYNVDLHYHAGQERLDTPIDEYIEHARMTARKVVGMTGHLGHFYGDNPVRKNPRMSYEPSLEGLKQYRRDMDDAQQRHPETALFFGPEVGPAVNPVRLPEAVTELSDFMIFEVSIASRTSAAENTDAVIARMREVRDFIDSTGLPAFIAHPLRSMVNFRLIKQDIQPRVTCMEPRWDCSFTPGEVREFFLLDPEMLGQASSELKVPLELNGVTRSRILSCNLPAPLQMLTAFYSILKESGGELAPGSDQHGFKAGVGRLGQSVPAECFHDLGITIADMPSTVGRLLAP